MFDYEKSDYSFNRNSGSIIYLTVTGLVKVSASQFLEENPQLTMSDYEELKRVSDEMMLEERRDNKRQTRRNISWSAIKEPTVVVSAEEQFLQLLENKQEDLRRTEQLIIAKKALCKLSKRQRRRYLLHEVHGMTVRKIAYIERVSPQTVHESIMRARQIICAYLASVRDAP